MGEVNGHKGVAVVLHVVVHAETGPVVSVNVANCGRGGEGSVSWRWMKQKRSRIQAPLSYRIYEKMECSITRIANLWIDIAGIPQVAR